MALMLLAGLQTIPRSLYEAAEVDGATTWQQFVEITLPMLRPAIFVALIFRTITAIQTFDIPYAMTGGGPGRLDRDARDVHPQDDARLPRLRLRLGAGRADVPAVDGATSGYLRYTRRIRERGAARTDDAASALQAPRRRSGSPAHRSSSVNGFFPALWILLTSLKTETELISIPITYLPGGADARQLRHGVHRRSRSCASCGTASSSRRCRRCCACSSRALAAYALTRLRIPHRNLIMSVLLAVAMFPLISLMVPLFKVMRELGLLNTYLALILPYAVLSMPVCTLVMASFFQDIPPDLEAAAMIDGCSRVGALFKVVIPLSAPGVFTAAILAFVNAGTSSCSR